MIKMGSIIAITGMTTTVASPATLQINSLLNVKHKDYPINNFYNISKSYFEFTYSGTKRAIYFYYVASLFNPNDQNYSAPLFRAVENFLEESYINDPFIDEKNPLENPEWKVSKIIGDWFDQNPTFDLETHSDFSELIGRIDNLSRPEKDKTINEIKSNYSEYIREIESWGVSSRQIANLDNAIDKTFSSLPAEPYFHFRTNFETNLEQELKSTISRDDFLREINDYIDIEAQSTMDRIDEIIFNNTKNKDDFNNNVLNPLLNSVILGADSFIDSLSFEEFYNVLQQNSINNLNEFVNDLIIEIDNDLVNLEPLEKISEDIVETLNPNPTLIFKETSIENFLSKYENVKYKINTTRIGVSSDVEILLEILDINNKVIASHIYNTTSTSAIAIIEKDIKDLEWIYINKDNLDYEAEISNDDSLFLETEKLNLLFKDYEKRILEKYPFASIQVSWKYTPDKNQIEFTFDVNYKTYNTSITRIEDITLFDNEFDFTFSEIEKSLQETTLEEWNLMKKGWIRNDILNESEYQSLFNNSINFTSKQVIISKFQLNYNANEITSSNLMSITIELYNHKSKETLSKQIYVSFVPLQETYHNFVESLSFDYLYKDYTREWEANDMNISNFNFYTYERSESNDFIRFSILDSIKVNNIDDSGRNTLVDFSILGLHPYNSSEYKEVSSSYEVIHSNVLSHAGVVLENASLANITDINKNLNDIIDKNYPTNEEMDKLIANYLAIVQTFTNPLLNNILWPGRDLRLTFLNGPILDLNSRARSIITISNVDGEIVEILKEYNNDFIDNVEIDSLKISIEDHVNKVNYITKELNQRLYGTEKFQNVPTTLLNVMIYSTNTIIQNLNERIDNGILKQDLEETHTYFVRTIYTLFHTTFTHDITKTGKLVKSIYEEYNNIPPEGVKDSIDERLIGISLMPMKIIYKDDEVNSFIELNKIVDIIDNLNKTALVTDFVQLDLVSKSVMTSIASTLGIASLALGIVSTRIIITTRKMKKKSSSVKYSNPYKLFSFTSLSTLVTAGATISMFIFVFITKGGF